MVHKKQEIDLKKIVNFIVSGYEPEKVILFGSYGVNMGQRDSDIDLLIIKQTPKRFVDRVVELVQFIRSKMGIECPIEPIIYTPEELEKAKETNSFFIRTILSKGVILYEKK